MWVDLQGNVRRGRGGCGRGSVFKCDLQPDGARWEAGLLKLNAEGHTMLGQDGCRLGCPLLISTCNGPGQIPCQLFSLSIKFPGLLGRSASGVGTSGDWAGRRGVLLGPGLVVSCCCCCRHSVLPRWHLGLGLPTAELPEG